MVEKLKLEIQLFQKKRPSVKERFRKEFMWRKIPEFQLNVLVPFD